MPARVALPPEPLPAAFAPLEWQSSLSDLERLFPGVQLTRYGERLFHLATTHVERQPMGAAELTVDYKAGRERFTMAQLARYDISCEQVASPPPGCGDEPSVELRQAFAGLAVALSLAYGAGLEQQHEVRPRGTAITWQRPGHQLLLTIDEGDTDLGWAVYLTVLPAVSTPEGQPLTQEQLLRQRRD